MAARYSSRDPGAEVGSVDTPIGLDVRLLNKLMHSVEDSVGVLRGGFGNGYPWTDAPGERWRLLSALRD